MTDTAWQIWNGSDGAKTRALYSELTALGPIGIIGVALFRANKCSARAKMYRGGIPGKGSYRQMAYEKKNWSLSELCKALEQYAVALRIVWGWREDPNQLYHKWVVYVELPGFGQVSFHSETRGAGPEYQSEWDGLRVSTERICAFVESLRSHAGTTDHQAGPGVLANLQREH